MAVFLLIICSLIYTGYGGLNPALPVYDPCPSCTSPGNRYANYAADYSRRIMLNVTTDVETLRGDSLGEEIVTASLLLFERHYPVEGVVLGRDSGNCPSVISNCRAYSGFLGFDHVCRAPVPVVNPCIRCDLTVATWASFYRVSTKTFPSMSTPGPSFMIVCIKGNYNGIDVPCRNFVTAEDPCDTSLQNNEVFLNTTFGFAADTVVVTTANRASSYSFSPYFGKAMASRALPKDFRDCPEYSYSNREFYGRSCHQYPVLAAKSIAEYVATGYAYIWLELRAKLYMSMYAAKPYVTMLGRYCPTEIGLCFVKGIESYFVDNAYMYSALWRQQRLLGSVPFNESALFDMLRNQHEALLHNGSYVHSIDSSGAPTFTDFVLNINMLGAELDCVLGHNLLPSATSLNLTEYIVGNWLRYDRQGVLITDADIKTGADYIPFVLFSILNMASRGCIDDGNLRMFPVLTSLNPVIFTTNVWAVPFVFAAGGSFSGLFGIPVQTVPYELQLRMNSNPTGAADGYSVATNRVAFQANNGQPVSASMRAKIFTYVGWFCTWDPLTNITVNRACMYLNTSTYIVCSTIFGPSSLVQYDNYYILQTRTPIEGSTIGPGGSYFTQINATTSFVCRIGKSSRASVVSETAISGFASTTNGSILYVDNMPSSVYKPWYSCGSSRIVLFQPFNVSCSALPVQTQNVPAALPPPPVHYKFSEHLYKPDPKHYYASGFKYVQFPLVAPPFCSIQNNSLYFNCAALACGNDTKCITAVGPICSGMEPILHQMRKQMQEVTFTLETLSDDFFANYRGTAIYRHRDKRSPLAVVGFVAVAFVFLLTAINAITTNARINALSSRIDVLQQQLLAIDTQVRSLSSQQIELAKIVDDRTTTLATAVNSLADNLQALSTSTASNFAVLAGAIGEVSDEVALNRYLNAFSTSYLSTASATLSQLSSVYVSLLQHKQTLNACAHSTFTGILSTACVPLSSMANVLKDIQVPPGCHLSLTDLSGYYSASLLAAVTSLSTTPFITVAIPYVCNTTVLPYKVYPRHFTVDGSHFAAAPKICFKGTKWLDAICSGGSCIPSVEECTFDYQPTTSTNQPLFTYLKNVTHPCTVYSSAGVYYDACDTALLGPPTYGTPTQAVLDLQTSTTLNSSVVDLVSDLLSNMTFPEFNFTAVAFYDNLTLLQQQMNESFSQYEHIMSLLKPVGTTGFGLTDIIVLTISCFVCFLCIVMFVVLCCCRKRHRD